MRKMSSNLNVYKFGSERNIFQKIRQFFDRRRFARWRAKYGFCEWDCMDLDTFYANLFIDSLTYFKDNNIGIPISFINEGLDDDTAIAKWKSILEEIIDGFKTYIEDDESSYFEEFESAKSNPDVTQDELEASRKNWLEEELSIRNSKKKKLENSFKLLAEYFEALWW